MAGKAATAPADDDDDTGAADAAGAGDGADDEQGDEQQPEVVCTILCYPDGSYGLTQGDEDEGSEGAETGGGQGAEPGAEPQRFASIGELLHGVMESVKGYHATASGEGSEADAFKSGFAGASDTGAGGGQSGGM